MRSAGKRVGTPRVDAAEVHDVAADANAELVEQPLADRAGGDARGRLARRGALEDVARVVAVVLEQAGEVGVAGPRTRVTARRRGSGSSSRGAGSMISCQFSQSRLRMSMAIGEPIVSPARTPERNSTSSRSICMRRPRP